MIKTVCRKCKRLNIVNLNIAGAGKIQMPCKFCNTKMIFDCKNKINFKTKEVNNENKPTELG